MKFNLAADIQKDMTDDLAIHTAMDVLRFNKKEQVDASWQNSTTRTEQPM